MNFRNPKYNEFGTIDCEIEHPGFGWIPFNCDPNDTGAEVDAAALFDAMKDEAAPYVPPPGPSAEQLQAQITAAIDAHVEAQARALQYNGAAHLASYVNSTVSHWAAEAQAFVAWRDQVWLAALGMLAEAQETGVIPSTEEAIAALPEWPGVEE